MAANNVPVEDTKRFRGSFETKITGIYYHRPEAAALDRAQQVLDKMNTPPPPLPAPPDSKKPG